MEVICGRLLRARSRKWRSISWFAVTEHGRLPLARIRRSDQVPLSPPLAEDVVTMKGKAVVHHQAGNEPRLAQMSKR
jgi:hypothetical protein